MSRRGPLLVAIAGSLLASACSMAPRYVRPAAPVPPSWPVGDAYLRRTEAALPAVSYREIFTDPKLLAIIDRALANNQDLRVALANVAAARANYRIQRAQLFPQVDVGGTVTRGQRSTANAGNSFAGGGFTSYAADFGLNAFEIDLFGRLRSLRDAQLQEFLGTEAAVRATRLTLVGELANAYLTLATDRSLLNIATDTQASAQRSVTLTRARLSGGVAPRSDLRQAETVLAQAQSDHANQTTLVAQDRNAIELLVGAPVEDALLPTAIEAVDKQLNELPAGLDSRILLRRPDVVQAEYSLRAANARIGSARAAFFPTISLTGAAGLASGALGSLFTGDAFTWSVTPGISLPIFDGGTRRGNLALS
ncbi:MAG: efflux transporter outer membrane subunit, partial [Sphingomonas sp.]